MVADVLTKGLTCDWETQLVQLVSNMSLCGSFIGTLTMLVIPIRTCVNYVLWQSF